MKNQKNKNVTGITDQPTLDPWPQETAKLHAAYDLLTDRIPPRDLLRLLRYWKTHLFTHPLGCRCHGPGFVFIENYQHHTKIPCSVQDGGVFIFDVDFLRESSLEEVTNELFQLMAQAMTFVEGTRSSDTTTNEARAAEVADRWSCEKQLPPNADPANN